MSLDKPLGVSLVSCSVEGRIALRTVQAYLGALAPKMAVIEGARCEMKLYRSAKWPVRVANSMGVSMASTGTILRLCRLDDYAELNSIWYGETNSVVWLKLEQVNKWLNF